MSSTSSSSPSFSIDHGSVHIYRATAEDSWAIADVLTLGFQRGGWLETLFQPLWYFSIYDDLRSRLTTSALPYACWLARYEVTEASRSPQAERRTVRPQPPFGSFAPGLRSRRSSPSRSPSRLSSDPEFDPNFDPKSCPESTPIATVELSVRPSDSWNRDPWFWQTWPWERFGSLNHLGQRSRPYYPYVANLAVIASARRLGIARRLLERCERTARAWGYDRLYLHVLQNNTPARSLYHQQGYRLQAETSNSGFLGWSQPRQLLLCKVLGNQASDHHSPLEHRK